MDFFWLETGAFFEHATETRQITAMRIIDNILFNKVLSSC
jgi:hypothetical protein